MILDKLNYTSIVIIDHEWFQVLVNKIVKLVASSVDDDITTFSFEGEILKVLCNNNTFVVSGLGKDWEQIATVKTKSLDSLPKRILTEDVHIYISGNELTIGNINFKLEI